VNAETRGSKTGKSSLAALEENSSQNENT